MHRPPSTTPWILVLLFVATGFLAAQEVPPQELQEWLDRRFQEDSSRFRDRFLVELSRQFRTSDPLELLPPARRRRVRRLSALLEALPHSERVRTGITTRDLRLTSLAELPLRIGNSRTVLVGEEHDRPGHHTLQFRVIELLHSIDPNLGIGMEMFDRSVQPVLDDYIAGRIDESTFLERSDWAKRWSFDFALYRPIVRFARDHNLPIVALNARREIVHRVARDGLASLSAEDRSQIASEIDTGVAAHRTRYDAMVSAHPGHGDPDRMYQAMCVWDETMAESAAHFLRRHPHHRLVVLAGNGHVAYGHGIPDRIRRRIPDEAPLTIVPRSLELGDGTDYEELLADPPADYIYFTR